MNLHHWPVVVAHCHLRVARVALHNFTHCFQLHTQPHTHTHTRARSPPRPSITPVANRDPPCPFYPLNFRSFWLEILYNLLAFVSKIGIQMFNFLHTHATRHRHAVLPSPVLSNESALSLVPRLSKRRWSRDPHSQLGRGQQISIDV